MSGSVAQDARSPHARPGRAAAFESTGRSVPLPRLPKARLLADAHEARDGAHARRARRHGHAAACRRARARRRAHRARGRAVRARVVPRLCARASRTDAHAALGDDALARARRMGVGAARLPLGRVSRAGADRAVRASGEGWVRRHDGVSARARLRVGQRHVLRCSLGWAPCGAAMGARARLRVGQRHVLRCSLGWAP